MSWIRQTDIEGPEVHTVASIIPHAMEAIANINQNIGFGSSALTRIQEECIATAVSQVNKCRY